MTIEIPVKPTADPKILVFHSEKEGVKGYTLRIYGTLVDLFIDEANADKIARYMLFTPPVNSSDNVPSPLESAYTEKTPQED